MTIRNIYYSGHDNVVVKKKFMLALLRVARVAAVVVCFLSWIAQRTQEKKFESQRKIHHQRANERMNSGRKTEWVNEWMCDDLLIQLVRDRQACALALCISFADIGEGALTSAMRRNLKFHKFINFLHGCRIIACYWKYFNEFRVFLSIWHTEKVEICHN